MITTHRRPFTLSLATRLSKVGPCCRASSFRCRSCLGLIALAKQHPNIEETSRPATKPRAENSGTTTGLCGRTPFPAALTGSAAQQPLRSAPRELCVRSARASRPRRCAFGAGLPTPPLCVRRGSPDPAVVRSARVSRPRRYLTCVRRGSPDPAVVRSARVSRPLLLTSRLAPNPLGEAFLQLAG
jgi:hypothetical protein